MHRGAQLTTLRRQILELLWERGRPARAYELIDALRLKAARPVGPPTIYRALDFLVAQGLAWKIESRNAYVACLHPERRQGSLFFICCSCGASAEVEDPRVDRLLARDASALGFRMTRRIVEVEGICAECAEAGVA